MSIVATVELEDCWSLGGRISFTTVLHSNNSVESTKFFSNTHRKSSQYLLEKITLTNQGYKRISVDSFNKSLERKHLKNDILIFRNSSKIVSEAHSIFEGSTLKTKNTQITTTQTLKACSLSRMPEDVRSKNWQKWRRKLEKKLGFVLHWKFCTRMQEAISL